MNYLRVYCNLIRKAENRTPPDGYTEKHHTFPVSIFGKNKRIAVLTPREHYIAHALLEKICIQRYGLNHHRTIKMNFAHGAMICKKQYTNSYLYENAKIRRIEIIKNNNLFSGENNHFYGKTHSEESKRKMSEALKGTKLKTPRTEEYKKMLSERMKNRVISEETLKKMSESKKGKLPWNKGKKQTQLPWNKNISKPSTARKYDYKLISPNNQIYITNNLSYFSKIFDEYKLSSCGLTLAAQGKTKHHKKWKIKYIEKYLDNDSNIIYTIDSENKKNVVE